MATEDETLAVLSDHHVVTLLASLVQSVTRSPTVINQPLERWNQVDSD